MWLVSLMMKLIFFLILVRVAQLGPLQAKLFKNIKNVKIKGLINQQLFLLLINRSSFIKLWITLKKSKVKSSFKDQPFSPSIHF